VFDRYRDTRIRQTAFEWLAQSVDRMGDVLPRDLLVKGFQYDDDRVSLLGPQGIFKPRIMEAPLSLTTSPRGPYDDTLGPDGLLNYRYRGTDPEHIDNRGMRFAMQNRLPLVYLHGIVPGKYFAAWPVFVVGDDPRSLTFTVAVDDVSYMALDVRGEGQASSVEEGKEQGRRVYMTSIVRRRLHQRTFREQVLEAYRRQCAFCRFKHEELLDAAHIIADTDEGGEPLVPNGLSLCKFHHAAFDRGFLGVRADYVLVARPDLLEEENGPTLVHSVQALHGTRIFLPHRRQDRPDPERLAVKYQQFIEGARAS
jgi:putative restriction endonuclease